MPSPVLAYFRFLKTRFLPHGLFDVVWQVLLFAAAYYAYRLVRGAVDGRASESFQHARELISVERSLHSFIEPTVQAWATSKHWIIDAASYMYVHSHFTVTIAALVYIYLFHNSSFYFVRNMFMIAMGIALIGYVVYPTAPPRFMPEWGFTDSVARFTGIPADDATINALYNPFAAVPSMHVGFALMLGLPLARLVKLRALKVFWLMYPLIVTFVVVSTGNHWWLDAFLGALTAAVSAYVADRLLARARPHVWAFGAARAEAPA
jgi:membrane-associated phospholipid phosphatase